MSEKGFLRTATTTKLVFYLVGNFALTFVIYILYFFKAFDSTVILIVTSIICFFFMSIIINEITRRSVDKKFALKFKPKEYSYNSLENIKSILIKNKANVVELPYATSYLLINNKEAYKILIVNDNEKYFSNTNDTTNTKGNNKLEQCTKFYGLEMFSNVDNTIIKKLQQYTFQSEKILYTSFYELDDKLIQAHYEEPIDVHKDNLEYILNLLEIKEYDS